MCLPVTPYKIEREWKHAGLSCAVTLARQGQHRCGYVRVPPGHPAFGKDEDSLDVSAHGGLTFAKIEPCTEHEDGQGWWLGFDCGHAFDATYDPALTSENAPTEQLRVLLDIHECVRRQFPDVSGLGLEHYWTEDEVAIECESLAEQLAAMGERP